MKNIERLNGVTGTYEMRNIRELCRAYLSLYYQSGAEPTVHPSDECLFCSKKFSSGEELFNNHWRCVEKHMLLSDPDSDDGIYDEETLNDDGTEYEPSIRDQLE